MIFFNFSFPIRFHDLPQLLLFNLSWVPSSPAALFIFINLFVETIEGLVPPILLPPFSWLARPAPPPGPPPLTFLPQMGTLPSCRLGTTRFPMLVTDAVNFFLTPARFVVFWYSSVRFILRPFLLSSFFRPFFNLTELRDESKALRPPPPFPLLDHFFFFRPSELLLRIRVSVLSPAPSRIPPLFHNLRFSSGFIIFLIRFQTLFQRSFACGSLEKSFLDPRSAPFSRRKPRKFIPLNILGGCVYPLLYAPEFLLSPLPLSVSLRG